MYIIKFDNETESTHNWWTIQSKLTHVIELQRWVTKTDDLDKNYYIYESPVEISIYDCILKQNPLQISKGAYVFELPRSVGSSERTSIRQGPRLSREKNEN